MKIKLTKHEEFRDGMSQGVKFCIENPDGYPYVIFFKKEEIEEIIKQYEAKK